MFAGPVFTREVVTAPRRARLYVARAAYVGALLILLSTAWQVLTGTRRVETVSELSRFGATAFQLLAPLQLAVALFFGALSAASAVAAEKDRRTLELLLLTRLNNVELVLGKLLASLVSVLAMSIAALPLFFVTALLVAVSFAQIGRLFAVVLASSVAAASLGALLAFWREKTYQSLAMTLLALVFWLAVGETLASGLLGESLRGVSSADWAVAVSPWRATLAATQFAAHSVAHDRIFGMDDPVDAFVLFASSMAFVWSLLAIALVRVWNPPQELRTLPIEEDAAQPLHDASEQHWRLSDAARQAAAANVHAQRKHTRHVWDNPILWREIRTWAYGRRILLVRITYLVLFALSAAALVATLSARDAPAAEDLALPVVPLFVLSLVLINVQAVTALTSERDARALDLLLVTDLTPREIIVGKLAGALYNAKEMLLLPLLLCVYLVWHRQLSAENFLYVAAGWMTLVAFVTMLGVHCGMIYAQSRAAIAISVGTVFFLVLGVATCMRIMVAFSGSFQFQLQPFLAFMVGGGAGLLVALGWRNASTAIWIASFSCPFATFYALTSLLLDPPAPLAALLAVAATYGFATAAMLIPAIYEFDVATGRTTGDEP